MPDKEYIEREAALEECDWYANEFCECEYAIMPLKGALENLPAADVRPVVKAEWYGEADGYADGELVYDMWSCPICGKRFEEWEEKPDWNYCPNCGARMEVDTNDS